VTTRADSLRDLRRAPGVGPATAADLYELGLRSLDDVAAADPQELYDRLCSLAGTRLDRCVLYVFRCAHHFATHDEHDPELLKWWNWKDRR
jgi:nucleotidyltransferase/DNA polymerase involved in DNA repair